MIPFLISFPESAVNCPKPPTALFLDAVWNIHFPSLLFCAAFNPATEVLPVSGTGESLILSHRKAPGDGSEEDSIEVKRHTSALHR